MFQLIPLGFVPPSVLLPVEISPPGSVSLQHKNLPHSYHPGSILATILALKPFQGHGRAEGLLGSNSKAYFMCGLNSMPKATTEMRVLQETTSF